MAERLTILRNLFRREAWPALAAVVTVLVIVLISTMAVVELTDGVWVPAGTPVVEGRR